MHAPQPHGPYTSTASSSAKPVVPAPSAATVPAVSWPSVNGRRHGRVPSGHSITCRSEWQSPAPATRTTTSPGPGSRSATSTSSNTGGWVICRARPAARYATPARADSDDLVDQRRTVGQAAAVLGGHLHAAPHGG